MGCAQRRSFGSYRLFEPITVPRTIENMCAVREPVEQGGSHKVGDLALPRGDIKGNDLSRPLIRLLPQENRRYEVARPPLYT